MDDSTETRLALLEASLKHMNRALKLQAKEYERRLSDLNHAHTEAQRVQNTYVSRELYDADTKASHAWRDVTNLDIASVKTRLAVTAAVLATVWAIVQFAIHFWKG